MGLPSVPKEHGAPRVTRVRFDAEGGTAAIVEQKLLEWQDLLVLGTNIVSLRGEQVIEYDSGDNIFRGRLIAYPDVDQQLGISSLDAQSG